MEVNLSSDFENKKPLNFKHWILFMHWNNISGFLASEFNSFNFQQIISHLYFSVLKNPKSNIQCWKIQLKYFKPPQIQHSKVTCKIECMKCSVHIRGAKEEQSILEARSRSSKESENKRVFFSLGLLFLIQTVF